MGGIVLVAAGGLLIAELQRLLEGGKGVESPMAHHRRGADRAAGDHSALKGLHLKKALPSSKS